MILELNEGGVSVKNARRQPRCFRCVTAVFAYRRVEHITYIHARPFCSTPRSRVQCQLRRFLGGDGHHFQRFFLLVAAQSRAETLLGERRTWCVSDDDDAVRQIFLFRDAKRFTRTPVGEVEFSPVSLSRSPHSLSSLFGVVGPTFSEWQRRHEVLVWVHVVCDV